MNINSVECRTALQKGNYYTEYDAGLFLSRSNPLQVPTLDRLQQLFWETNQNFDLARIDGQSSMYATEYQGLFDIPWVVVASGLHKNLLLSYRVKLKRPDLTLQYTVAGSKRIEFYRRSHRYSLSKGEDIPVTPKQSERTRIDGLPIYLRFEEWVGNQREDGILVVRGTVSRLRLFANNNESPEQVKLAEENRVIFEGRSKFSGAWIERWYFDETGKDSVLNHVDVLLKGKWNPK